MRATTINGRQFYLDRSGVERAVDGVPPEPLHEHYVTVRGLRYPPKQVLGCATGLDRADFTTHQARRILMRLGFPAARRTTQDRATKPPNADSHDGRAEALRPFIGQWVALADGEVLTAALTPAGVVGWLSEHGRTADVMFRVPESEFAAGGASPA